MLTVRVERGTNAGWKLKHASRAADWQCTVGHANPGFAVRCLTVGCRDRRPKDN